jgi:transposase
MIRAAVAKTKSNRSASRYLNVSYQHFKKWAKTYDATEPGYANIFE